jgi:hypothetical protein
MEDIMGYEDIKVAGDLTKALEAWLVRRYGNVVDLEVGGISEGEFAAVGYAAVENAVAGTIEAVVLLLQHDQENGADSYRLKDMTEDEGPMVDYCPERILDQLSPTNDVLAAHWRERCRDRAAKIGRTSAFTMNS